jgi:hypothetical protein
MTVRTRMVAGDHVLSWAARIRCGVFVKISACSQLQRIAVEFCNHVSADQPWWRGPCQDESNGWSD